MPLDRLLLETDSYPLAGRTTEPAEVAAFGAALAALRGLSPDDVARATTASAARLLRRLPPCLTAVDDLGPS